MYQEFYADSPYVMYAIGAFVFFLGVFLLVLLQQLLETRSDKSHDPLAYLPFEDREHVKREQT